MIHDPAIQDPAVQDPAVQDAAIQDSAILDSAILDSAILDSAILDSGQAEFDPPPALVEALVPGARPKDSPRCPDADYCSAWAPDPGGVDEAAAGVGNGLPQNQVAQNQVAQNQLAGKPHGGSRLAARRQAGRHHAATAAARWIDAQVEDAARGGAAGLIGALDAFESIRRTAGIRGRARLVLAWARGEISPFRRSLVDGGAASELVAAMSPEELGKAFGLSSRDVSLARRLGALEPDALEVVASALASGLSVWKLDMIRRLWPIRPSAEDVASTIETWQCSDAADILNAARLLLADAAPAGDDSASGRRSDARSESRLEAALARTVNLTASERKFLTQLLGGSSRRLKVRARVDVFQRLGAALDRRVMEYALGMEPAIDRAGAFQAILVDALTSRHPLRQQPATAGSQSGETMRATDDESDGTPDHELAGAGCVVRTLCPPCFVEAGPSFEDEIQALAAAGRLRRDGIPEAVVRYVLMRDTFHCQAPGCTRMADHLHHHGLPQRESVDHSPDNLVAVCSMHHLRHLEANLDSPRKMWVDVDPASPGRLWWTCADGRMTATLRPIHRAPAGREEPSRRGPGSVRVDASTLGSREPGCGRGDTGGEGIRGVETAGDGSTGDGVGGEVGLTATWERVSDLAQSLRVSGRAAGLSQRELAELIARRLHQQCSGSTGEWPGSRGRGPILLEPPVPLPGGNGLVVRHILASTVRERLARAGYAAALAEMARPAAAMSCIDSADAGSSPVEQTPHSSVQELARVRHQMSASTASEERLLGESRLRFPHCWRVHLGQGGKRKHLLSLGRSEVGIDHDVQLAPLMRHLKHGDFVRVLRQLERSAPLPDGVIRFEIELEQESRELLARVALEIRRAHGCNLNLEQVLDYLLQIEERGSWPPISGRPFQKQSSLGAPSLTRRVGPPRFASTTFECARCELVWQHSRAGELLFPDPDRIDELRLGAGTPGRPRVRLLSRHHDPDQAAASSTQPRPRDERAALARDGGCRVPGCPHGPGGQRGMLRAVALCQIMPGLARAHGALSTDGNGKIRFDLRGVGVEGLVTVCASHLRAIARNEITVDESDSEAHGDGQQLRWLVHRSRAAASEALVVKELMTPDLQGDIDLESLRRRVAMQEAAGPPPVTAAWAV